MNAPELLSHLTSDRVPKVFEAARKLPPEKLDWKPAEGARSALDMLQEIATAPNMFKDAWEKRKIEWSPERMAEWHEARRKLTSIDELERVCTENTRSLIEFIGSTSEADLELPVQMPFPGDFKLADILAYHYWNASYHEGQINYILSMLGLL